MATVFEDISASIARQSRKLSKEELLKKPETEADRLRTLEKQLGLSGATAAGAGSGGDGTAAPSPALRPAVAPASMPASAPAPGAAPAGRPPVPPRLAGADTARTDGTAASAYTVDEADATTVPTHAWRRFEDLTLKQKVWELLDDPSSSRAAQLIALLVMLLIIVSCAAFVIQTLPEYVNSSGTTWVALEYVCITVFTVEFVARFWSAPARLTFLRTPLNIIDLLAILPFYLELIVGATASGSAIIRIVRLVRVFRVFKLSRYLPWVRVFTNALALSLQPLIMLILVIGIGVVLFSSVIYYAERGEWSEEQGAWMRIVDGQDPVPSPYQSIPASFWWCMVTMTTVGYGDVFPVTTMGRFIAVLASLSGILVVAIPVSVISTNFNGEFGKLMRQREQVKARMLLLRKHFRERKTGLEAVLDELEDIVTRNTQELQGEVEALFDAARSELVEELSEIMRMAFERRRQLHLAALAAGRVQASVVVPEVAASEDSRLSSRVAPDGSGAGDEEAPAVTARRRQAPAPAAGGSASVAPLFGAAGMEGAPSRAAAPAPALAGSGPEPDPFAVRGEAVAGGRLQ